VITACGTAVRHGVHVGQYEVTVEYRGSDRPVLTRTHTVETVADLQAEVTAQIAALILRAGVEPFEALIDSV